MNRGQPIPSPKLGAHSRSPPGSRRILSSSPLAEQALADDIAACSEDGDLEESRDELLDQDLPPLGHGMYRRPSGVAYGTSRPIFSQQLLDEPILTPLERKQSRDAERSLLRDNRVLPPKHQGQEKSRSLPGRIYHRVFSTRLPPRDDDEGPVVSRQPTERAPLLSDAANGIHADSASGSGDDLEEQWEEAVASGRLRTTWQRETKTVVAYSAPLIATFFLQYSINVASIFAVGRIGKVELGAVSCELPRPSQPAPANPALPSGQHVGGSHLPGALSGSGHESRHTLRSSLWVRPQAARRGPVPAHGGLSHLLIRPRCRPVAVF